MTYIAFHEPLLSRRIESDLAAIVDAVRAEIDPVAIMLGGSFGRGEGAGALREGKWTALNDYDVWVVTAHNGAGAGDLGRRLARELDVDYVDIAVITEAALRALTPSQLVYDLRHGGRVLWGRRDMLDLLPEFDARDIPPADALTLLFNRAAGLIGHFALADLHQRGGDAADATQAVQLAHAWTACGDAALILTSMYDHRSAVKADRVAAPAAAFLGGQAVAAIEAAYRARLSVHAPAPVPRAVAYSSAAATLLRALEWAIAQVLPAAASVDGVAARLDAYEHSRAVRGPRAMARRARAAVTGRKSTDAVRAQVACARALLLSCAMGGAATAAVPDDWDRIRLSAYEAWHHACH